MGPPSRRTFTPAFKAQVFLELLSEQRSSAELCRELLLRPPFARLGRTRAQAACPPSGGGGSSAARSSRTSPRTKACKRLPGTAGI